MVASSLSPDVPAATPGELEQWLTAVGASKDAIAFAKHSTDLAVSWLAEKNAQTLLDLTVQLRPTGWLQQLSWCAAEGVRSLMVAPGDEKFGQVFVEGVRMVVERASGGNVDPNDMRRQHNQTKAAATRAGVAHGKAVAAAYAARQAAGEQITLSGTLRTREATGKPLSVEEAQRAEREAINQVWVLYALADALTDNVVWAASRVVDRVAKGGWTTEPFGVRLNAADIVRFNVPNPFRV